MLLNFIDRCTIKEIITLNLFIFNVDHRFVKKKKKSDNDEVAVMGFRDTESYVNSPAEEGLETLRVM